jgi:hypothetical protein
VRGRNLKVLIPAQRDKGNEQPDPNQGNEERAEETPGGGLVHEFLHDDRRDDRNAQNKQEIDQMVGDRVPGKGDCDGQKIGEGSILANDRP